MHNRAKIFISYRREGGAELARLIREQLQKRRYEVFMDVEDLRSGPFNTAIFNEIEASTDVVVVLTPGSLDRCVQKDDWLRLEVVHAIRHKKNIVPVKTRGFQTPQVSLIDEMTELLRRQGIEASHEYFEASVDKLAALLVGKPKPRWSKPILAGVAVLFAGGLVWWSAAKGNEDKNYQQSEDPEAGSPPAAEIKTNDIKSATPADGYALGRDLCFLKEQWQNGLPFLAEGLDSPTRTAALKDLNSPISPRAQIDVGLAWVTAAKAAPDPDNWHCYRRARHWFVKALADPETATDDALRATAEKHLQAVPALDVELRIHIRSNWIEDITIARDQIKWRSHDGLGPNTITNTVTGKALPEFSCTKSGIDYHTFTLEQVRSILPEAVDFTTAKLNVIRQAGKTGQWTKALIDHKESSNSQVMIRVREWDSQKQRAAIYNGNYEMDLTLSFGK